MGHLDGHPCDPIWFAVIGSYADPAADVGEGVGAHGWDHGLGEIVNALIEAGPGIESLVEHPFLDWDVDFLTKAPDGTFRLPQGTAGELPLVLSIRATKPLD